MIDLSHALKESNNFDIHRIGLLITSLTAMI